MPFTPDTPESRDVSIPSIVSKDIDEWHIHEIHILRDPNNPAGTAVTVTWSMGYRDNGTYCISEQKEITFEAAQLATKMAEQVASGRTVYDAIKFATWELIAQYEPDFPSGDIT